MHALILARLLCSFLPSEELSDSEAEEAQGGPESEQILFVFARSGQEAEEEAEEEEPAEEEQEVRGGSAAVQHIHVLVLACVCKVAMKQHGPAVAWGLHVDAESCWASTGRQQGE